MTLFKYIARHTSMPWAWSTIAPIWGLGVAIVALFSGCSDDLFSGDGNTSGTDKIQLTGEIDQEYKTRVNDSGFCDGDVMGTYIVDYDGETPGTLKVSGNRADNLKQTFDEANYKWTSAYDVYWKDKHTAIDVYGYYPFASPESIEEYSFTVQRDQSTSTENGTMGGYEASDFLWGKVANVAPTTSVIRLPMAHKMANARVTLVEGSGFSEGEWASTEKIVLAPNLIREAKINLSTGEVTANGSVETTATIPSRTNDEWRAIVVPQTVTAGTTLFSITIGGVPYKFNKQENFTYTAGKMSNFGIRVDKKGESGQYQLTLISESITAWENDLVSHDATMKEYVVINSTAGHLADSIAAACKDLTKVKNLKITGEITAMDFAVMRYQMTQLAALNMKEVHIVAGEEGELDKNSYKGCANDEIPVEAMYGKETLVSLVLPDQLKYISGTDGGSSGGDRGSFAHCSNLSGSLIIPEGVIEIGRAAFANCTSLTGSLSLPSTLKKIGRKEGYTPYWDGAFHNCNFTCELILPESLEEIGMGSFYGCKNLYGELRLPGNLTKIGEGAFDGCQNFSGNLEIPQGVTTIPSTCFNGCKMGGTLTLHDGITAIGSEAFANNSFKGELDLPKNLEVISEAVFYGDDFSGNLVLPSGLRTIGDRSFAYNWRLMGILEIPENVISIGAGAFAQCWSLEGVVFPEAVENIRYNETYIAEEAGAFQNCYGIGSIVCKGSIPPYVMDGAFNGVAKDNFALEVPESSITQYQASNGWKDFKRITAHHELVCRPSIACALNTEHKQTLTVDAEGEWELQSKPDWCELSQTSGNKKTEVTLTIKAMASGSETRTGEVVFKLKDKDYTHKCTVSQYNYEYGEDEYVTLQKATKGNNGGINIVILGDGYDAEDISSGEYMKAMKQEVEYFFAIEPYTTYRDYFNVYTAIPLSTETGVGTVNTIRYNRFNTTYTGGVGLKCDYDDVFEYALKAPTVTSSNLNQTLIIIVPNSTDYGGICQMWEDGSAIAFCPQSDYGYPLDSRGVIQHEAGGHGFGKLGDEYIYHNTFIDNCSCTCCGHVDAFNYSKSLGWYDNLSLTGKTHSVGWSHLIYHEKYSSVVDIFEGGYMHNRGVFRSEQNSCMNNDIPYYSTISRQSIVKRIKEYAGETYSFDDFVANDVMDAGTVTRSVDASTTSRVHSYQMPPTIHKGKPLSNLPKGEKTRAKVRTK